MTEFEIRSILLELGHTIDAQFNFWMASTFAVAIASYVAGHQFNKISRFILVALYLMACAVFTARYYTSTSQVGMYIGQLRALGGDLVGMDASLVALQARRTLLICGTVFAVVIVMWPNRLSTKTDVEREG